MKGFWKSGANLSILIFDTGPICTQKKAQIEP